MMLIQQILKMDMDGKNCLANECVDILWKIMEYLLGLQDITTFMVRMEHMMEEGKKLPQHYVEKS